MNQKQTKEYGEYLVSLTNGNDNIDLNYIIENRPRTEEDLDNLAPHLHDIVKNGVSYEVQVLNAVLNTMNTWVSTESLQIFGMKDEDRKEYNILQGQTIVKLLTLELEPLQLIKPKSWDLGFYFYLQYSKFSE